MLTFQLEPLVYLLTFQFGHSVIMLSFQMGQLEQYVDMSVELKLLVSYVVISVGTTWTICLYVSWDNLFLMLSFQLGQLKQYIDMSVETTCFSCCYFSWDNSKSKLTCQLRQLVSYVVILVGTTRTICWHVSWDNLFLMLLFQLGQPNKYTRQKSSHRPGCKVVKNIHYIIKQIQNIQVKYSLIYSLYYLSFEYLGVIWRLSADKMDNGCGSYYVLYINEITLQFIQIS